MNKNQRYKGFAAFKVNLDYQVSIPPHWRPEAGASLFLQFSIEQELPLAVSYTHLTLPTKRIV